MKNIHLFLDVFVLVVLWSIFTGQARNCDVTMSHTWISGVRARPWFFNFFIYLLIILLVSVVSFRPFRFVVSDFSTCPTKMFEKKMPAWQPGCRGAAPGLWPRWYRTSISIMAASKMEQVFQKQLFPRLLTWNLRNLHNYHGKVAQRLSREGILP